MRDLAAFKRVVGDAKARAGRVDYLFNNAGIVVGGELSTNTAEDWDDVIDVNLRGVVYGVLAAITPRPGARWWASRTRMTRRAP